MEWIIVTMVIQLVSSKTDNKCKYSHFKIMYDKNKIINGYRMIQQSCWGGNDYPDFHPFYMICS